MALWIGSSSRRSGHKTKRSQFTNWRFLTALSEYKAPTRDSLLQDAEKAKLDSDFKLDMLILNQEGMSWSRYLTALRLLHADTHTDRVEEQEAGES